MRQPGLGKLVIAALGLISPAVALAQEGAPPGRFTFEADALAAFQSEADLDGSGTVSASRAFASFGATMQAGEQASIGIQLGFGGIDYDFANVTGFPLANELGWVRQNEISLQLSYYSSERLAFFLQGGAAFNGEAGVDSDDGTTANVLGGFTWQFNPRLTIGPGVGFFEALEGDDDVIPILLVDWQISVSDRVSLSTARGLAASRGPGLALNWQATEAWSFGLQGRFESIQFRLDDNHGTAANGVGEETYTPLVATATWQPSEGTEVMAFAGAALGGEFTLYDANGNELSSQSYDAAPLFGFVASFSF